MRKLTTLLGLFVLSTPAVALAQDLAKVAAELADAVEVPWWLQALLVLASAFGAWLLNLMRKWLSHLGSLAAQKTNLAFLSNLDDIISAKVAELWQTEVEALKAAAADGKLTSAEKAELKAKAIAWVKSLADPKLLLQLFGASDKIEAGLGAMVERGVVNAKALGSITKPPQDPSKP